MGMSPVEYWESVPKYIYYREAGYYKNIERNQIATRRLIATLINSFSDKSYTDAQVLPFSIDEQAKVQKPVTAVQMDEEQAKQRALEAMERHKKVLEAKAAAKKHGNK